MGLVLSEEPTDSFLPYSKPGIFHLTPSTYGALSSTAARQAAKQQEKHSDKSLGIVDTVLRLAVIVFLRTRRTQTLAVHLWLSSTQTGEAIPSPSFRRPLQRW